MTAGAEKEGAGTARARAGRRRRRPRLPSQKSPGSPSMMMCLSGFCAQSMRRLSSPISDSVDTSASAADDDDAILEVKRGGWVCAFGFCSFMMGREIKGMGLLQPRIALAEGTSTSRGVVRMRGLMRMRTTRGLVGGGAKRGGDFGSKNPPWQNRGGN